MESFAGAAPRHARPSGGANALRTSATSLISALAIVALLVAACAPAGPPAVTADTSASPIPAAGAQPDAPPATGSSDVGVPPPARKLNVVATTTYIQEFAREVGGDRVNVLPILGPSDDPHDYQPMADDARKIAQADVILANGIGLEPWLDVLARNARSGTPVVKIAEVSQIQIEKGGPDEPEGDPHVWQDPTDAQKMVNAIRDTVATAEPAGQPAYVANAAAYNARLDQLDQQVKQQIGTIPTDQRKLVTNHDAFGYYARRYGLTIVGAVIPSVSTEAEPSAGEVQQLIQAIKAQGVKAIYTETNLNPRLEQQIAQQAGVKIYANLYGDALGPPGSDGDTYVKAMLFNTREIVDGLR